MTKSLPGLLPQYLFPTRLNRWLWNVKTALARMQATRAMTVSRSSAADLEAILRIPRKQIDLVTEAADPAYRHGALVPQLDRAALLVASAVARSRCRAG